MNFNLTAEITLTQFSRLLPPNKSENIESQEMLSDFTLWKLISINSGPIEWKYERLMVVRVFEAISEIKYGSLSVERSQHDVRVAVRRRRGRFSDAILRFYLKPLTLPQNKFPIDSHQRWRRSFTGVSQ